MNHPFSKINSISTILQHHRAACHLKVTHVFGLQL